MFGNLGEMANLMKSAMKIQENLKKAKDEMASVEITASSADGSVKATISGDFSVRKIEIAPGLAADSGVLGNMVAEALNNAINEAKDKAREHLGKATGGLNIPGLF